MEQLKLLIVDADADFRRSLVESFRTDFSVTSCGDGLAALELLHSFQPQAVVLDLMLPGLDGITVLRSAAREGLTPIVLALTPFSSPYIATTTSKLGVGHLMLKPCEIITVRTHLTSLIQRADCSLLPQIDQASLAADTLLNLHFLTNRIGYHYLLAALAQENRAPGQAVIKELYQSVADQFQVSIQQVERNIRSAIEKAWAFRDRSLWMELFPPNPSGIDRRPSNGLFISRVARYISTYEDRLFFPCQQAEK